MSALIATRNIPKSVALVAQQRKDPAPSKMTYRLQRLWLRKYVRPIVQIWLPVLGLALFVWMLSSNEALRTVVQEKFNDVRASVAARPELTIESISIPVGSVDLVRQIDGVIDLALPVSAMNVDLEAMRQVVQNLSAVKSATVQLSSSGQLVITIEERIPRMVWRNGNRIFLLDETGIRVAEVPRRAVRIDLPLVIGGGADVAINEARLLYALAAPLEERIRALVRVGERRWDLVLDGDQVIKLPEFGAQEALRHVIAMQTSQQIMDWNLSIIDMRDPSRPLIRLNDAALKALSDERYATLGEPV